MSKENNISDELDQEINDFVDLADSRDRQRNLDILRDMFVRHVKLEDTNYYLDAKNLQNIIDNAKRVYVDEIPSKLSIDAKAVRAEDKPNMAIVISTIRELRTLGVLRRVVKFLIDKEYSNK